MEGSNSATDPFKRRKEKSTRVEISKLFDSKLSYDVFLSFRGEDTHDNFADYLYRAFIGKGIHTFRDDDEIGAGKEVNAELMKAIQESKYSVLIISENYASSSWCLNELAKILESKEKFEQVVYALFYRVDPSDVRKQAGKFGEGFSDAISKNPEKTEKWREALKEIAGFKGWVYPSPGYGTEADFIEALTGDIFTKLKDRDPCPLEGLVGMRSRMEKVNNLLDSVSDEDRIVGIWGMGGLGKTTIARAVYDSIYWQFDGFSFIENVREIASKNGLTSIQEQIISDTLKVTGKVMNVKSGMDILRKRVCYKKVLVVLDDVDDSIELGKLIGDHHRFSPGSRIIITTRDRQCLDELYLENIYQVQELNRDEAEELFKSKAFAKNRESENFQSLTSRAIKYAGGVPLALNILGSFLYNLALRDWESALDRLKKSPGDKVQKVLRISYDGLDPEDKDIFLDVACFFKGYDKDEVFKFFKVCGFNPRIGIENLVRKSLLTSLENNAVWMHDLLQKMGWTIVKEESIKKPGKRSRLWDHDDIKHVLLEDKGTENIEGICDFYSAIGTEDLEVAPNALSKMTNLRLLRIGSRCSPTDLPNKLCYLHWRGYPLKQMPYKFRPKNLVELRLTNSCIEQIWDGEMDLLELRVLDLCYSKHLTKSPDFKGFPNLEKLSLGGCIALRNLHPSIKNLKKLTVINLKDCSTLETIPDGIESQCLQLLDFSGCLKLDNILEKFKDLKKVSKLNLKGTSITEVPQSIGNSTDLRVLNLDGCEKLKRIPSSIGKLKKLKKLKLTRCYSLNELPEEVGLIESLEILALGFSGVRKLPSVVFLKNLQSLFLYGCSDKQSPLVLPSLLGFGALTHLNLENCGLKSVPESISCCLDLEVLVLSYNDIESLPTSIKDLSKLEELQLQYCKTLKVIPELPSSIEILDASGCESLEEIPELPSNIRNLMAYGCESLKNIDIPFLLKDARKLCFSNCSGLVDNKEIKTLMKFDFLFNQIKANNHALSREYIVPGSEIPKWFTYQKIGPSMEFHLSRHDLYSSKLLGLSLSAVVSAKGDGRAIEVQISVGDTILEGTIIHFFKNFQDVLILYLPIQEFIADGIHQGGIDIKICFVKDMSSLWIPFGEPPPEVKSCGARLIYEDDLGNCIVETQCFKKQKRKHSIVETYEAP